MSATINSENEFRTAARAAKYKWALLYFKEKHQNPHKNHSDAAVIVFRKNSASIHSMDSAEQL